VEDEGEMRGNGAGMGGKKKRRKRKKVRRQEDQSGKR
jgi:hypothetical protein